MYSKRSGYLHELQRSSQRVDYGKKKIPLWLIVAFIYYFENNRFLVQGDKPISMCHHILDLTKRKCPTMIMDSYEAWTHKFDDVSMCPTQMEHQHVLDTNMTCVRHTVLRVSFKKILFFGSDVCQTRFGYG